MKKSFKKQTVPELQKHIRATAKLTENIFLTHHSKARMKSRKVLLDEVYDCIRQGVIRLTPEDDMKRVIWFAAWSAMSAAEIWKFVLPWMTMIPI